MILLYIYILFHAACVGFISAVPHITVSAPVGSTVVLPCKLTHVFTQTSVIRWRADEIVFERSSSGTYVGEGYERRVDVPEDELHKRNCSLVLKDVRLTDDDFYRTFVVEHVDRTNTDKEQEIYSVTVSVNGFQISAAVGSTVVLPCEWRDLSIQTPHVEWYIDREVVFERQGKETFQGEGYEGRVDVPEDELHKGNCSLVLKNVSVSDEGVYRSSMYMVKHKKKPVLIQKVQLSVSVNLHTLTYSTMGNFSCICTVWISTWVDLLSAEPEISVSGPVGSTAVLPCELTSVDTHIPYIIWKIKSESVFEREGVDSYQAGGYEGRVDVPEEELHKGNCSLVLHNLTFTDTGVYTSYQTVRHTKRSGRVRRGTVLINSVKLSVYEKPEERSDNSSGSSDDGGRNRLYSLSLIFLVFLLCGVILSLIKKKKSNIQL